MSVPARRLAGWFWPSVGLVLMIGSSLRLYGLLNALPFSDEAHYTRMALDFRNGMIFPPEDASAATRLLFIFAIAGMQSLGAGELLSGRLVSALFGIAVVGLTMALAHRLYQRPNLTIMVGLWAALLPQLVAISRGVFSETMCLATVFLFYFTLIAMRDRPSFPRVVAAALVAVLGLWTKEYMVLALAVGAAFLMLTERSFKAPIAGSRRLFLPLLLLYVIPFLFVDNLTIDSFLWTTRAVADSPVAGGAVTYQAEVIALIDAAGAWHPAFWLLVPVLLTLAGARAIVAVRQRSDDLILVLHAGLFTAANLVSNSFSYRYLYVVLPIGILAARGGADLWNSVATRLPLRTVARAALAGFAVLLFSGYARVDAAILNDPGIDQPIAAAVDAALEHEDDTLVIANRGHLHTINYLIRRAGYREVQYERDYEFKWTHVNATAVFEWPAAPSAVRPRVVRTVLLRAPAAMQRERLASADLMLATAGAFSGFDPEIRALLERDFRLERKGRWLIFRRPSAASPLRTAAFPDVARRLQWNREFVPSTR